MARVLCGVTVVCSWLQCLEAHTCAPPRAGPPSQAAPCKLRPNGGRSVADARGGRSACCVHLWARICRVLFDVAPHRSWDQTCCAVMCWSLLCVPLPPKRGVGGWPVGAITNEGGPSPMGGALLMLSTLLVGWLTGALLGVPRLRTPPPHTALPHWKKTPRWCRDWDAAAPPISGQSRGAGVLWCAVCGRWPVAMRLVRGSSRLLHGRARSAREAPPLDSFSAPALERGKGGS